jgi:N-acyl-D-aspartate/D-glutamate deacylase
MMSWSNESLIEDGRSQSEIRQGVTLEVMGEGWSMGPLTDEMKDEVERRGAGNPLVEYDVGWTTLGQYLEWLERRGVSPNVASFVGASTVRIHEMGYDARSATEEELGRMRDLVREAMVGRARRRLGADLSAGDLLDHGGARCARRGRRGVRRDVCLAHPQRGRDAHRSGRGAARDRSARGRAG